MGNIKPISTSFSLPDGREVTLETGKLATQADGSVVVRCGDTMLLATVVSAKEARPGQDFFPLSVDYQEKFAAAGRIPGNFFRRETKLSESEVLVSRLVDRALRPLFPDNYLNETQIIITLMSGEKDVMPDVFVALAASTALSVSDIVFNGPISEVRVAKIDGQYVVNPTKSQVANAEIDIIIGATMKDVTMVEGEARECSESDLVQAIKVGHDAIKVQIEAQLRLAELVGEKALIKRILPQAAENLEVKAKVDELGRNKILELARSASDKKLRKETLSKIKEEIVADFTANNDADFMTANAAFISKYFDKLKKEVIRGVILNDKVRLDGRKHDQIRPIWCEVDYLPSTHGSAIFNRGETQALASATLGTKQDEMMVDNVLGMYFDKFFLHYNFPPFSVGEVKPLRAPGRREVGHANLAGRSLRMVFPKDYPYTVRIVSDVLESNGSSSMATVCSGSLALMDAGIPIIRPVSGIAMGLVAEGDKVAILSDILGDEDALGDMDFKVTGTEKGICGCQMDIKIDGMPYELLEQALMQAREGRLHILSKMNETLNVPREDLKPHAPRIAIIEIDRSFIGAIIGPGGSIIQEMQRQTNTVISIEEVGEKGIITIASPDKSSIDAAIARVSGITFVPTEGEIYLAKVASIQPFGVFVDFPNSKGGLVHISEIAHERVNRIEDVLNVGDDVNVKYLGIDKKTNKARFSIKACTPVPEGYQQRTSNFRSDRGGDRDDRRRSNDRPQYGDRRNSNNGNFNRDNRDNRGDRDQNFRESRPPFKEPYRDDKKKENDGNAVDE
ncbi:MAG: polyribonucleotide nucleotidyltransferase [Saprospiraceae bacterium]|nr:polyribonucleotide nucleotidyltransferase [Saprospiraceae bacterium]